MFLRTAIGDKSALILLPPFRKKIPLKENTNSSLARHFHQKMHSNWINHWYFLYFPYFLQLLSKTTWLWVILIFINVVKIFFFKLVKSGQFILHRLFSGKTLSSVKGYKFNFLEADAISQKMNNTKIKWISA